MSNIANIHCPNCDAVVSGDAVRCPDCNYNLIKYRAVLNYRYLVWLGCAVVICISYLFCSRPQQITIMIANIALCALVITGLRRLILCFRNIICRIKHETPDSSNTVFVAATLAIIFIIAVAFTPADLAAVDHSLDRYISISGKVSFQQSDSGNNEQTIAKATPDNSTENIQNPQSSITISEQAYNKTSVENENNCLVINLSYLIITHSNPVIETVNKILPLHFKQHYN